MSSLPIWILIPSIALIASSVVVAGVIAGLELLHPRRRRRQAMAPEHWLRSVLDYQHELDQRQAKFEKAYRVTERFLHDIGGIVDVDSTPMVSETTKRRYVVGSWLLQEAHSYLTQKEPEWMCYVTGLNINGVLTLDRLVTFHLEQQSAGYVKGDEEATRDALCDIEQFGQALHSVFHSHRMRGAQAVSPSAIDRAHQERLERGRYRAISAIFSDDGYIRFFSLGQPFQIEVSGKGVERVDDTLFKLTEVAAAPRPRRETAIAR